MSAILRIFRGAELIERELGAAEEFAFGSGKKDTVCMEDCGLSKKHLMLRRSGDGWQWKATKPAKLHGKSANEGSLESGEILLLDQERRLAVMVVERNPDDTRLIDLSGESAVQVGRSGECDIVIASRQVSGRHLELRRTAEGWSVRDVGSSNGTYLNGTLVREAQLNSGDILDIGPCRMVLTGDNLSLSFRGGVKNNLVHQVPERTAAAPEDPYPCQFHPSPRLKEDIT